MTPYIDPYTTLGVLPDAGDVDIKRAYFTLVRAHPPERDPDAFKTIRAAYERINTPEKRLETDMRLLRSLPLPAEWPAPPPPDLTVHRTDLVTLARAGSDLERTDFREDYRKVKI